MKMIFTPWSMMKCKIILILYFQTGISQEDFQAEKCSVHHHIDLVIGIFDDFPRVVWSPPIWKVVIENNDIFCLQWYVSFQRFGYDINHGKCEILQCEVIGGLPTTALYYIITFNIPFLTILVSYLSISFYVRAYAKKFGSNSNKLGSQQQVRI